MCHYSGTRIGNINSLTIFPRTMVNRLALCIMCGTSLTVTIHLSVGLKIVVKLQCPTDARLTEPDEKGMYT
jgi:hypothetical protein